MEVHAVLLWQSLDWKSRCWLHGRVAQGVDCGAVGKVQYTQGDSWAGLVVGALLALGPLALACRQIDKPGSPFEVTTCALMILRHYCWVPRAPVFGLWMMSSLLSLVAAVDCLGRHWSCFRCGVASSAVLMAQT